MNSSVGVRNGFTLVCLMICIWRVNRVPDPVLRGQPCRSWIKNVWCLSSLIRFRNTFYLKGLASWCASGVSFGAPFVYYFSLMAPPCHRYYAHTGVDYSWRIWCYRLFITVPPLLQCSLFSINHIILVWQKSSNCYFLSERQDPGASNGAISLKLRYVSEKC